MQLKKLLIYLTLTIVIVIIVDLIVGWGMRRYVTDKGIGGDYRTIDYLLKDFDNDVLILGSSVALNSLDPKLLGDSLNLDVYNGASNGQTLTYHLVLLKSILNKRTPKAIILGITPENLTTEGVGSRLNMLSPYYNMGYEAIDEALNKQTYLSKLFLHSNLYQYNTIWLRILLYGFVEPGVQGVKGFIAKDIPSIFPSKEDVKLDKMTVQRRQELAEFITLCRTKNVKLIVFFPPEFINLEEDPNSTYLYKDTKRMLQENNFILYNDVQSPVFLSDSTLFYDNVHLNINGAELYTNYFINRIKNDSIF